MFLRHATAPQPDPRMSSFSRSAGGASLSAHDEGATSGSAAGTPIAAAATPNARRECEEKKARLDAMARYREACREC